MGDDLRAIAFGTAAFALRAEPLRVSSLRASIGYRMTALRDLPPAFSVPSLARRWECSEGLIRKMIERGELRSFRLGVLIRVPAAEVERIECQTLTPSSASEADMPSSITMTAGSGDGGGSMPKIDRARRPRLGALGNPATIHRGPWGD